MGANTVVDFAQIPHSVTISLGNVWMGVNQDISLICVTKRANLKHMELTVMKPVANVVMVTSVSTSMGHA